MRYKELDALRGLAALMVVFFHFTMGRSESALGFKLGTTGVDLFFIISGFVILLSLDRIEKSSEFVINRISRLYPTYWTCVTLTFSFMLLHALYESDFSKIDIFQYLGNMTMFQYYLRIPNLEGPYWTMIIEMVFYIAMVILFRFKLLNHLNKIGVFLTITTVILASFYSDNIWVKRLFYWIPLLKSLPLFFAGTLFYKIVSENNNAIKYYALLVICLISQILLFNYSGRSHYFIDFWEYALMISLYFTFFTFFVKGKLKFIVNRTSLFLGKISFALYLIHQKISTEFIIPVLINKFDFNFWMASFIALIVVIVLASLVTYVVEVPYSRKMRKKLYAVFNIKYRYASNPKLIEANEKPE